MPNICEIARGGLRNYRWSARVTNSTRIPFAKSAKRSASGGPIFPDRKAAFKVPEHHR
jgi:hypothetical protein